MQFPVPMQHWLHARRAARSIGCDRDSLVLAGRAQNELRSIPLSSTTVLYVCSSTLRTNSTPHTMRSTFLDSNSKDSKSRYME